MTTVLVIIDIILWAVAAVSLCITIAVAYWARQAQKAKYKDEFRSAGCLLTIAIIATVAQISIAIAVLMAIK